MFCLFLLCFQYVFKYFSLNGWYRGGIVLSKLYIKDENYFVFQNISILELFLWFIFINKWLRQSNVNLDFYLKSLNRDIRKIYVNF